MIMPIIDTITRPAVRDRQVERELERERGEHAMNHDAKAHLSQDDGERNKDARQTTFSAKVRR
jgi:hypothetical protein